MYESYLSGKVKPKYDIQDKDGKIVNVDYLEVEWFEVCKKVPNIVNLWKEVIEVNRVELERVKKEIKKYY